MLARRSPNFCCAASASLSWVSLMRSAANRISPSSFLLAGTGLLHQDPQTKSLPLALDRERQGAPHLRDRERVAELRRVIERLAIDRHDDIPRLDAGSVGGA